MDFRRLNTNELADFADNLKTLLAGTELASLDPGVRASLLAEIGTLPADLAAATQAAMVLEEQRMAAITVRNELRARARAISARTRDSLKASVATQEEYDLCGFDHRTGRSLYVAQDPTDLSVDASLSGVYRLKFAGNNRAAQVVYQIWRREGADGRWLLLDVTKRQTYADTDVVPGRRYEYKVRAVAARTSSNFSNVTVTHFASASAAAPSVGRVAMEPLPPLDPRSAAATDGMRPRLSARPSGP